MFKGYIALLVRKTVEGYSMFMSIVSVGMPCFAGAKSKTLECWISGAQAHELRVFSSPAFGG